MEKTISIVLVGGKGSRLGGLTKNKSKSYVSFLGKNRIIDFPLSSLSYSNITDVGILTQYEPYDLIKYIGSGSSWDLNATGRGIAFLTPYQQSDDSLMYQKGTANAVLSQIDYIKNSDASQILILSGDQAYKIDFRKLIEKHDESNAELTILTALKDPKDTDLSRFGIVECDKDMKVTGFEEKPLIPKTNRISLGIYLFNRDFLLKHIKKADELIDFGHDFIPYLLKEKSNLYAFDYNGFFMDIGTIKSLWEANMYHLDNPSLLLSKTDGFTIYSKPLDYPPHHIKKGGLVNGSIVADGSEISGVVKHSVISYKAVIEKNTTIEDSVILPFVTIKEGVHLKNTIVDENLTIEKGSFVFDEPTLIDINYLEALHE